MSKRNMLYGKGKYSLLTSVGSQVNLVEKG